LQTSLAVEDRRQRFLANATAPELPVTNGHPVRRSCPPHRLHCDPTPRSRFPPPTAQRGSRAGWRQAYAAPPTPSPAVTVFDPTFRWACAAVQATPATPRAT